MPERILDRLQRWEPILPRRKLSDLIRMPSPTEGKPPERMLYQRPEDIDQIRKHIDTIRSWLANAETSLAKGNMREAYSAMNFARAWTNTATDLARVMAVQEVT